MTFAAALLITLLRAAVVGVVVVVMATPVAAYWRSLRCRMCRASLAVAMLALLLTPTIVVGYAWTGGPLSLARFPVWNELMYSTLLGLKLLPIAAGVLILAPPPPISDAGAHVGKLLRTRAGASVCSRLAFALQGRLRHRILAFCAVFLLAFHDFELSSLFYATAGRQASAATWSYGLHEFQQLLIPAPTLLGRAAWAAGVSAIVIGIGLALLFGGRAAGRSDVSEDTARRPLRINAAIAVAVLALALAAVCFVPAYIIVQDAARGVGELADRFRLFDELFDSLFFAAGATLTVLSLVAVLRHRGRGGERGRARRIITITLCIAGLLGPLALAATLLWLFEAPGLRIIADTPLRLITGLTLWLAPLAVIARLVFDMILPTTSRFAAQSMLASPDRAQQRSARRLMWVLQGRPWFWLGALVFVLAYFELALSVTLHPVRMTPVMVELYNQMHYGQRALLSASVVIAMAAPVALLALATIVRRAARP